MALCPVRLGDGIYSVPEKKSMKESLEWDAVECVLAMCGLVGMGSTPSLTWFWFSERWLSEAWNGTRWNVCFP
jgi:hypothetical protein